MVNRRPKKNQGIQTPLVVQLNILLASEMRWIEF